MSRNALPQQSVHPESDGWDRDTVVVTRFQCGSLAKLLVVALLHPWIRHEIQLETTGLVASSRRILWRQRTLLSVSMWQDLDSIYTMGRCGAHVAAARLPHHLGISTTCGIFTLVGDWKRIMFESHSSTHSPLRRLESSVGSN